MTIQNQTQSLTKEQKNLLKMSYANHMLVQKIQSQISIEKMEDILLSVPAVTFQEIVSKYLILDKLKRPRLQDDIIEAIDMCKMEKRFLTLYEIYV